MYRIECTSTLADGSRFHVLKACPGYYGWGYELPDVRDSMGAVVSCVQFDTRGEAISAAIARLDREAVQPQ